MIHEWEINAMNKEMVDPRLTTKIVGRYLGHHAVGTDQVSELITSVHRAVSQLGKPPQLEEVRTPSRFGAAISTPRICHLPGLWLPG